MIVSTYVNAVVTWWWFDVPSYFEDQHCSSMFFRRNGTPIQTSDFKSKLPHQRVSKRAWDGGWWRCYSGHSQMQLTFGHQAANQAITCPELKTMIFWGEDLAGFDPFWHQNHATPNLNSGPSLAPLTEARAMPVRQTLVKMKGMAR